MGDFNAGFSFEFGGNDEPTQAPWEFAGALGEARKEQAQAKATSIDYKIQKQLQQNGGKAGKGAKRKAPAAAADSESEDEGDDNEEGLSLSGSDAEEGDSDAPLPGELDGSDSDDGDSDAPLPGEELDTAEEEEEEVAEEEISDGEVSEEEEEQQQQQSKRQQQREAAAAAAQPHKRGLQQQQQEEEDRSGDEWEDEEAGAQQAQQGPAAKRRKGEDGGFFSATPADTRFSAASFADLNLSRPLVKACQALGYAQPTPIQAACIPLALTGRDICGSAITGSGKTAAFSLPLLERLLHRNKRVQATYVLVLTPVRELAVQVHSMIQKLAQFTDIRAALVVGGLSLQAQAATLRSCPEIVVATPGRMIDHVRNTQSVGLEDLQALVLDEADRLLEMGFAEEVRELVRLAPPRRQTMLFSATMTEEVQRLVSLSLRHPVRLAADAAAAAPKQLTQEIVRLKGAQATQKEAQLLALCSRSFASGRTIVFAKTKQRAHRLKILFGLSGLPPAGELHGDMTQAARLESLERFRRGELAFLLATDVAARGLDILGVEAVINYDCPAQLASYLHRVGRTARAGAAGRAVTFIEDGDRALLREVIKKTGVQMQQRQVPAAAVEHWQQKIDGMEHKVLAIIYEEREERALRKAEMEAQKAANMLEHEEEIYSRPARTWFQTGKQKQEAADRARAATTGQLGDGDDDAGMTSKQKKARDKNQRRLEQKQARAKEEAAAKQAKGRNKLMEETAAVTRTIRAAKSREHQLRLEGVSGSKAGRIAAALVSGTKHTRQKKKKSTGGEKKEGGEGGLFSGDGISKPGSAAAAGSSKVYSGGAHSGKLKTPKAPGALSQTALNKIKRGGKGKHSFKSKARHKRRK